MDDRTSRLREEYQTRINSYDTLLEPLRIAKKTVRNITDLPPWDGLISEIRRLKDLKQLCVQIIHDLEDLE